VQADLDAADTTPTADEELARQVAAALQPEAELATSIGDHLPYVDDAGQLRDPAIQRDRPNPDSRLFGQATTRTRYRGHANHPSRRGLTEGDAIGARTSLHPLGWTQGHDDGGWRIPPERSAVPSVYPGSMSDARCSMLDPW
jgi:hypothetical protein